MDEHEALIRANMPVLTKLVAAGINISRAVKVYHHRQPIKISERDYQYNVDLRIRLRAKQQQSQASAARKAAQDARRRKLGSPPQPKEEQEKAVCAPPPYQIPPPPYQAVEKKKILSHYFTDMFKAHSLEYGRYSDQVREAAKDATHGVCACLGST